MFHFFKKIFRSRIRLDTSPFSFDIAMPDLEQISKCRTGDLVRLWMPPDQTFINIYRRATVGGDGLLGKVPPLVVPTIKSHLKNGHRLISEILTISDIGCVITSHIKTKVQIEGENERLQSTIREELRKPYSPKAGIKHEFNITKGTALSTGDQLSIQLSDLRSYEVAPEAIKIPIVHQGRILDTIANQSIARKLIRARCSGYDLSATIASIEDVGNRICRVYLKITFQK